MRKRHWLTGAGEMRDGESEAFRDGRFGIEEGEDGFPRRERRFRKREKRS